MSGRRFAIGDVHGCDIALDALLGMLAPSSGDTVILLGDLIDRGPHSRRVIEILLDLRSSCRLVSIRGNHEEMMFDAIRGGAWKQTWWESGGKETLASYGGTLDGIPDRHREFLAAGLPFWESESEIFVHANLEPEVPLDEQTGHWLRWQRLTGLERPHPSGKRVICGHTPQPSGLPLVRDGWICLDTLVYAGRYLTALDLESGELYQAQQTGRCRHGMTLRDLA